MKIDGHVAVREEAEEDILEAQDCLILMKHLGQSKAQPNILDFRQIKRLQAQPF